MLVVETLAPLILLIALGAGLAHIKFLGRDFMNDLNKLAFWIALPALLFTSANHAAEPGAQTWLLLGVMVAATLLIIFLAWGASFLLKIPREGRGTLMQSAFRANLAYIAIPVLTYSLGGDKKAIASAVIVMVLLMASYNVLAVIVLQSSHHATGTDWRKMGKSIATNPLMLAGLLGLIVPLLNLTLPQFVDRALQSLGNAAIPIALLCIGGALAITPLRGRRSWITAAALLKVAVLPFLVFWMSRWVGLGPQEQRIALVFAACPTAAASFVMAKQMGGDEALASGSIALSTILSAASLAVALWATS